jgi:cyclopropane-fatty-acyl-phospholipid synthase
MLALITAESDLVVRSIEDFGFDYARTLRDWRTRFLGAFEELKKRGYDERFKRLWEYYLAYCEGGFRERALSVVQLMATRPQNRTPLRRI